MSDRLYQWTHTDSIPLALAGVNPLRLLTDLVEHGVLVPVDPDRVLYELDKHTSEGDWPGRETLDNWVKHGILIPVWPKEDRE